MNWNSGLITIRNGNSIPVYIPVEILGICNIIQKAVNDNEFILLCKCRSEGNGIVVGNEYYIPEQEVGRANAEIKENVNDEWNVLIHSHPFNMSHFSSTDDETNGNYKLSILYSQGKFVNGIYNIREGDMIIEIPVDIHITAKVNVNVEGLEKIKERTYIPLTFYNYDIFK